VLVHHKSTLLARLGTRAIPRERGPWKQPGAGARRTREMGRSHLLPVAADPIRPDSQRGTTAPRPGVQPIQSQCRKAASPRLDREQHAPGERHGGAIGGEDVADPPRGTRREVLARERVEQPAGDDTERRPVHGKQPRWQRVYRARPTRPSSTGHRPVRSVSCPMSSSEGTSARSRVSSAFASVPVIALTRMDGHPAGNASSVRVVTSRAHPAPPARNGSSDTAYIGSRWRLVSVASAGNTTTVPDTAEMRVRFHRDHRIVAFDGINALNSTYGTTKTGYNITSDVATTLAGEIDLDPGSPESIRRATAKKAIHSVAGGEHVDVLSVDKTRLVLRAGGLEAAFVWAGSADDD
jgi:hypothetical protein